MANNTRHQQLQEQIGQQDELLTSILEALRHPFFVINANDYNVEMANAAARGETLSRQTTCYALIHDRTEPCTPSDHPCPIEEIKRTKKPVMVEHIHRDAAGQARNVEVYGCPLFDEQGNVVRVIEYSLDVTERKQADQALRQSERRYRQLLEALHEGIWVIDKDANTTFVNPRMAEMLGYTIEEMQGKHLFSFMDERGIEMARRKLESRAQGIREQHDFEFLRKDGTRIYTLLETAPIFDDDGNYSGGIAGIQDITERRRAEEAAQEAAATAERTRLARDLHDSVTQALFSASLVAEVLPQVWRRDPAEALQGLEELRHLTRSALAEMRTMLLELRPSALLEARLNDLLAQLTEATTSSRQLVVTLEVEEAVPALPPDVHVMFYRVAQEALNNIVKHAEAGHVTVSLHASPPVARDGEDHLQGQVTLQVSDDGRGFDLGRIEPGKLGLGIMQERATAVGAMLDVRSQPGHGTQVTLLWPHRPLRGSCRPVPTRRSRP